MADRVVVSGSRSWTDYELIRRRLDQLSREVVIVHGACPQGADEICDRAAWRLGFRVERHPAAWRQLGNRAGLARNDVMLGLDGVVLVLAFRVATGPSPGTDHVIATARRRGMPLETWIGAEVVHSAASLFP